ncbi:MAG: hypothetical protein AVDCRST_MAG88-4707, partial [uncultured Thermomicrobiales bacterium]
CSSSGDIRRRSTSSTIRSTRASTISAVRAGANCIRPSVWRSRCSSSGCPSRTASSSSGVISASGFGRCPRRLNHSIIAALRSHFLPGGDGAPQAHRERPAARG